MLRNVAFLTLLTLGPHLSAMAMDAPVIIGAEARLPANPRSDYSRYVNWRPADTEVVHLNPPRMSWPYWPEWPNEWGAAHHVFTLQIASDRAFSNPVVNVTTAFNFYNTLPELSGANTWYWRIGYDRGQAGESWSPVRSFVIADDAVVWDRSKLLIPQLVQYNHPRILFNHDNIDVIRGLAKTHPESRAALEYMRSEANGILKKSWWKDFPKSDTTTEPKERFYGIAGDLTLVCFVWRTTGDDKYAGVKERAVTWASYPPGGRASPEGLGGDGAEDASQGNEFLALLFDWLYQDLNEEERNTMIHSLEWRVDHIMNSFAWRSGEKVPGQSLSGTVRSHQYEASMDTAACGLALYEHSEIGREWFELMLHYLIGITCGHGFDEAWNEGPGYGTSKMKWLMNATMYFDTALPDANLGKNPFYRRIGDFFSRVIPVGMEHNAWGNQRNASRSNHLANFRRLAYLTGEGRFLLNWREYGGDQFSTWRPWIAYVLPACYETPEAEPEKDYTALFPTDGWAMAMTAPPSLRATYQNGAGIIFQCRPRGGYGHSFNSDGSFQLFAYGQMLNHGGGSSANKDAFSYHTMSHNTLLIDGLGQAQPSVGQLLSAYGRLIGFEEGENYTYMAGDLTDCYPQKPGHFARWGLPLDKVYTKRALPHLQRFIRHILFVEGKYFIVFDDLSSSKPALYTWLYHILPDTPLEVDPDFFTFHYTVGDVEVKLQHFSTPNALTIEDRKGLDGFINPFTEEDYRKWRKEGPLCGHNLWISNAQKACDWRFLALIYPAREEAELPSVRGLGAYTIQVDGDVICFNPKSAEAEGATLIVDTSAMHP